MMRRAWTVVLAAVLVSVVGEGVFAQQSAPAGQSAAQAAPANLDEYMKLVRSDVQKDKAQIVGLALELDATQSAAFWPVYKQYEAELAAIGDKRYAGIKDYAANYGSLTDAKATELTDRAIGLEEERLALVKRYVGELRKVLPAVKVGRWYQTEMGLIKIVDLRLAAEIPLAR
jgi:FlaG/FlaF family flagellin (archaellin)